MSYKLKPLPLETLNMDLPPNKRWNHIVSKYKQEILKAYHILDDRIYQLMGSVSKTVFNTTIRSIINLYGSRNHHYEELIAIANILDVPFYKVVIIQYGYELFSACTSAVMKLNGKTTHLRTMDWTDNSLRPLTIQLQIMKNNEIIADTTTWAGFIGFMTIVKPNVCSISINHRLNYYKEPYRNLWGILSGRLTISYLIRQTILNNDSYDDIIKALKTTPISAPCYITIGCVNFNESMILVRDRNDCQTHIINIPNNGHLIQTNIDPDDYRESMNRTKSIERRHIFSTEIYHALVYEQNIDYTDSENLYKNPLQKDRMMKLFLKGPIIKFNVIYACVMIPSDTTELNYTKYVAPSPELELMINGTIKKFWDQCPSTLYDDKNEQYDDSIY